VRRFCLLATVGVVASLASAPVQAAGPALIFGLIAAGVFATAVGVTASNQAERDVWVYTEKHGWLGGTREDVASIDAPLTPMPGTSERIVNACRDAIAKNAEPYDVASLEAVSGGKQALVNGRTVAPIEVRAIYRVRGVHEVRRSTVRCEIDTAGQVIATL
jgi:hypothetical protein